MSWCCYIAAGASPQQPLTCCPFLCFCYDCCHDCYTGGWGPALVTDPSINIPTKDVMFINNVLVNPSNASAMWSHFAVSVRQLGILRYNITANVHVCWSTGVAGGLGRPVDLVVFVQKAPSGPVVPGLVAY